MGRSVMLGNGKMLVGLNENGLVHDFYYPYVGLDNLTTSRSTEHKIGVWVDGVFSWLGDKGWKVKTDFEENALISNINASNKKLGIELYFQDFVDDRYTAFCRSIKIKNISTAKKKIKFFLHQVFEISRDGRADTALYVPEGHYLLDYKGRVSLLIYAETGSGKPFDQFAVGLYGKADKEGTFRDAEDGILSGSLVEHGGVDSVLGISFDLEPHQEEIVNYWIVVSDSQFHAEIVHHAIKQKGLEKRLTRTRKKWEKWLLQGNDRISKIDTKYQAMTKKSLMVVKAHIDQHGGIIASCDSSIYNYGRDYYTYVWPRDGALTMLPLIDLGYYDEVKSFFEFCADTIHPAGYMMHKYQPDRAIGSTWHPLMQKSGPELAIQEDETASVIYAIGRYFEKSGDLEFVETNYEHFIKPAANFMSRFIDGKTNLPHASYDLWEEKFGTHTYTVASVISALNSASDIAKALGNDNDASNWFKTAVTISENINQLFSSEKKYYRKSLLLKKDGSMEYDETLDSSSPYGFLAFNNGEPKSELAETYAAIERVLFNSTPSGGIPRYENDSYFLNEKKFLGNPWIICTLWLAQFYMRTGKNEQADQIIKWVIDHKTESGMLAEQVDPETGVGVGVSPLVWSHAELIVTLLMRYDTNGVA